MKAERREQRLHGNLARVDADKDAVPRFLTQAISNEVTEKKNVPLISDVDVKRERDWNIENKL